MLPFVGFVAVSSIGLLRQCTVRISLLATRFVALVAAGSMVLKVFLVDVRALHKMEHDSIVQGLDTTVPTLAYGGRTTVVKGAAKKAAKKATKSKKSFAVSTSAERQTSQTKTTRRLASTQKGAIDSSNLPFQQSQQKVPLYLQYFSHDGWSNQVICVKYAYYMAKAMGRLLVTAPVLPHFHILKQEAIKMDENRFDTNLNLDHVYLQRLDPKLNLAMGQVLDLGYTFSGVETMGYKAFRTNHWKRDMVE